MSIDPREAAQWLSDFLGPIPDKHFSAIERRALVVARALLAVPSPSPPPPSDIREAPVFAFLLGEGPLEGYWFGEHRPSGKRYPANFWWRKHLRAALTSSPPGLREAHVILQSWVLAWEDLAHEEMSVPIKAVSDHEHDCYLAAKTWCQKMGPVTPAEAAKYRAALSVRDAGEG